MGAHTGNETTDLMTNICVKNPGVNVMTQSTDTAPTGAVLGAPLGKIKTKEPSSNWV